jgi:hypothetical protein
LLDFYHLFLGIYYFYCVKLKIDSNKIIPWGVFGFSLLIYLLTVSKTVNFWDCGELIACSDTLQTGHAPGAPFYLLLGRLFAMFAFNPENTALAVNLLSAFASAFAVYFTFLSIQIIGLRVINGGKLSSLNIPEKQKINLSYFAALTGSLSLAFSASFWSSAIEAEVYSVSTLFTALTIWIMLRFTQASNEDKNRWLLLASLITGISTGVHLLNILVIPALVIIYYFTKFKFSIKSFLLSLGISILLLGFVQVCISGIPVLASKFEWFFANNLGAGFNVGLYIFATLLILVLIAGIYFSGKYKKRIFNLIITGFAVFLSGYSTYTIVIIRSSANPPLDQNNPETIFNFISYLNREQYGNRPLWYGQQYNSKYDKSQPYVEGEAVYDTLAGKYAIVSHKPEANFENSDNSILPRMWSNKPEHIVAYQEWTGYRRENPPPFGVNLGFMLRYQFSHMYLRYFMWNFCGRQNDFQSHGGPLNGNWITGIGFLDNLRISHGEELPPNLQNNKANNAYYLIPLLLGLIGIFIQFKTDKKYLFVLSLLFLFTGLAIAFYLNQHPYQARERDYSYIGSFYTFSIWIGLGVIGVYSFIKKYLNHKYLVQASAVLCIAAVPTQFLIKNYDDHNNQSNDFALNFAFNMLNSCEENAILFVSGDNETFPLWYLQESEHIRTDVRVINLSFLNNDWYIDQILNAGAASPGINLGIVKSQYISGQRELLPVKENPIPFIEDIYINNKEEFDQDYAAIFDNFTGLLEKSGYSRTYPTEYKSFVDYYQNIEPQGANRDFRDFCTVVLGIEDSVQRVGYGISDSEAQEMVQKLNAFINKQITYPINLEKSLQFVFSDDTATKVKTKLYPYPIDYFPAKNLMLPIDKKQVLESFGKVQLREDYIVDNMIWQLNRETISKSELMVLQIICSNNWKRPIYFSSVMNSGNYLGLDRYLYLEGLAFRLIPVETDISADDPVNINSYTMYENLTKKFKWGNLRAGSSYYDENTRNILLTLRSHYSKLARGLYFAGAVEQSAQMLNECVKLIPNDLIPFEYYSVGIVHGYYRINKNTEAGIILIITAQNALAELEYYSSFPPESKQSLKLYQQRALKTIEQLYTLADQYKHKEIIPQITGIYEKANTLYSGNMN